MVATSGMLDRAGVIAYVQQRAPQYGLDPAAVLAVANHEGLNTQPGATWVLPKEAGFNFGPPSWYTGGAGSPIVAAQGQAAANWAWTPSGIDYWLGSVAQVAQGKTGTDAIQAIVTGFERPAAQNVSPEVANASADYGKFQVPVQPTIPGGPIVTGPPSTTVPAPSVAVPLGGFVGAIQTLVAGTLGPNLANLGIKPDMSGLILLLGSLFAILIGVLIWRGDDVKGAVKQAPQVAAAAVMA